MLHADVDGSLEALTTSLLAVNTGRIVYKVVTAAVGPPSSRDVQMALDTGASIVCFGVSMPTLVQRDADMRGVSVVQSKYVPCSHVAKLSVSLNEAEKWCPQRCNAAGISPCDLPLVVLAV